MAKFAVLLFAALAFQAAFAGVYRSDPQLILGDLEYGQLEGLKSGQLENLVGQLQTVAHDVSVSLQTVLPNNRQVVKTLTWQSRELAQYIDTIIDRLQAETNNNSGKVAVVLQQVVSELREIQISLRQVIGSTDLSGVSQLKNQLNTNVQNAAEQIEKLVRLVQTNLEETQGSLRSIVKSVIIDLLTVIQNIQSQIQFVGVQGGQSPRQLAIQIQEVTNGLTGYLQGLNYLNNQQVKLALREYVQNVEAIISRLQKVQGTVASVEIDSVIQQVYNKLRRVLVPVTQITESGIVEDVDVVRTQLIRELQVVAEEIEQLVQLTQIGSQQTLIQEVLGDYLTAIQQLKIQIQGGLIQGGLLGQTGSQGLYSGLLDQSRLQGVVGDKFQGLTLSGKSGKGLAIQIQVVASDLAQSLQNVYVDNVLVKKTLINLIREYAQELEIIVERLQGSVNYNAGSGIYTPQQIAQNLREIVVSLQQISTTGSAISAVELRSELALHVQNIANELQKLVSGVQTDIPEINGTSVGIVKMSLIQFLAATRNLQVQILNISHVAQVGQTSTRVGFQIQTLANGLVAALESVSIDNLQARQILVAQSQELAQQLENIIERLQGSTGFSSGYGIEIPQQVAQNLRQLLVTLRQVAGIEDITSAQQLKMQLIVIIQEAAAEIQKLLWIGENWQDQGKIVNTILSGILNDFVATLQNQQIQLQTIYQSSRFGQNTQQLTTQIQAITNNLAIFLQNVPSNGEQARQNIEIQARKLAKYIENIVDRLEIEITQTNGNGINILQQVVLNLKQVAVALEKVTGWETTNSVYGLRYQLNVVLQRVASELRKLAVVAQSDLSLVEGNLNTAVRSVLVQYLVVLQRVQIELQGINQTVQIGQTPRELALQVQIIARRLTGILRVAVPDNRQTQISLVWQARYLSQILENTLNRLQVQISSGNENVVVLQQIVSNLRQIQLALQQITSNVDVVSSYQLKNQLAIFIQDAAIEIQKLMWVAQSDLQQGQANVNGLVKGVLIDFLAGLQNLQMQIQTNLQIVLGGQHPRDLAMQIQSVASRLFAFLQWAQLQSNSQQLRQTLVIQIGELTQTIENLVQMIQAEIKNNGEHTQVLHQIVAQLTKLSLALQKINGAESVIAVSELSAQLALNLDDVVSEVQRLAFIAQSQLQQTKLGNTNGVLRGALNNFLATLRTMLIQLQNTHQFDQSGQNTKELANQIQTVTTKLTTTLQTVATGTKQVRQALAIQTLKYARRIQRIVERLEAEVNYNSGINFNTLQQVAINLRQIVLSLQQIGGSLTTKTTTELRNQLNNEIQNADAEIQKLLLTESSLQQDVINTVVKSALIEYLAAVQNLQIKVQFISHANLKGLTLPQLAIYIESVISDISVSLQRVVPGNKLVGQTIIVEARQLAKVIANIVNKLQTKSVSVVGNDALLQQVASQLKEIQLSLQQIAGVSTIVNVRQQRIQLEVNVQRAIVAIEQLIYAVQPQLDQTQIDTEIVSLVREVLNDFLVAVQNVQIQLQNVLQNGQVDQIWGLGLEGQQIRGLGIQGQQIKGLGYQTLLLAEFGVGQEREYIPRLGLSARQSLGGLEGRQSLGGLVGRQSIGGLVGRQSLGGLEGRQFLGGLEGRQYLGGLEGRQIAQSPRQLVNEIQFIANDLSAALQSSMLNGQQATQTLSIQARQIAQLIRNIITQLEGYENVDTVIQQVIYKLREVQLNLQRLAVYNIFGNIRLLKTELDNQIQIVVAQIQRLVLIAQEETEGDLRLVIKNILNIFLNGLQDFKIQIQNVAQNGELGLVGQNRLVQGYGVQSLGLGQGLQGRQYGSGLQGLKTAYGLQGRTVGQLANQIQIVANQVVDELQTVAVSDKQVRQVLIIQVRQLIQIIDNIVDRLQVELAYGNGNIVQQVPSNLRQIRLQLQQILDSGVITTVSQIKAQIANYIQEVASELQKLALVAQSDVQQVQIVKSVLVQYLVYLRNVQYQVQYNVLDTNELGSQLELAGNGLLGSNVRGIQNWAGIDQLQVGAGSQERLAMW